MSLLDNIGKKAAALAQDAAKKSGDLVEVTKLNLKIGSEESKIEKSFIEIGKAVLAAYKTGSEVSPEIWTTCDNIKASEAVIAGLKARICEIKKIKVCEGCGAEIAAVSSFCAVCGAKVRTEPS